MNEPTYIGTAVLVAIWVFGLWKAIELWSPKFAIAQKPDPKAEEGSILPTLFWTCYALLLVGAVAHPFVTGTVFRPITIVPYALGVTGLIAITIRVEITAMSEPKMIRIAAQHNVKTPDGLENVVYWTRGFWALEKPGLLFLFATLFILALAAVLIYDARAIFAVTGFVFLFGLWSMCRYTMFAIKKDEVSLHRWLERYPTKRISASDIADIRVDQPTLHGAFGVSRLSLTTTGGETWSIALQDPSRAVTNLNAIR